MPPAHQGLAIDMELILKELLASWGEIWRYPRLCVALAAGKTLDAGQMADALIEGKALPRSLPQAIEDLCRQGEFQAVRFLLDSESTADLLAEDALSQMEAQLSRSRRRIGRRIDRRCRELSLRASRVKAPRLQPPEGLTEALQVRLKEAQALLESWESEIAAAERSAAGDLESQLEDRLRGQGTSPVEPGWARAVRRCLDSGAYDIAAYLMDHDGDSPLEDPLSVPRQPPLPWRESLSEMLTWFRRQSPAPPDFASDWESSAQDASAMDLVDAIWRQHASPPSDPAAAQALARALDVFLGGASVVERPLVDSGESLAVPLYSLEEQGLPLLSSKRHPCGVLLWMPQRPDAQPPPALLSTYPLLVYFNRRLPEERRGAAGIDASFLLSLALLPSPPHRRTNFLRWIGGQLDLSRAIPEPAREECESLTIRQASSRAAWSLDFLGLETASAAFFDRAAFYSGGDERIMQALLRQLVRSDASREAPVSLDSLEEAWHGSEFRDAARELLLGPVESEPLWQAALGAALFELSSKKSVSASEVQSALELWSLEAAAETLSAALGALVRRGLLEEGADRERFQACASGLGELAYEAIEEDLEEYVQRAVDQLA